MSLREDVEKVQDKLEKTSVAMELLEYSKQQNKQQYKQLRGANIRMFIVWIITFIGLIISLGYIVYLLNDINTDIDTIDIDEVETIDNSHIKIGDDIWEKYE